MTVSARCQPEVPMLTFAPGPRGSRPDASVVQTRILGGKAVEKTDFNEGTKYAVTLKTEDGRLRPANFFVYKLFDEFMIVRMTDKGGLLHKIAYPDVVKIVKTIQVASAKHFMLPAAMLDPKAWKDRNTMQAYGSAPGLGK
jgi:hypothetical protein